MTKKQLPDLTPLELEVMDVVWDHGECSSSVIVDAFSRKRKLAATTIRTVLSNIESKGYLRRVPTTDRAIHYRPTRDRERVASQSLRPLVGQLFGGSPKAAIAHLIANERLDESELDELKAMLEARRKEMRQ